MDPQATWQRLLDGYDNGDLAEAKEAADDLLWLSGGGFPPQVMDGRSMDAAWNRFVADAACRFVSFERGI